jgi:drug/metabolite transporter (DMT)-like permease
MTPWEEMASRQGVWLATADNLKRNLTRTRWITLCLSVLGALLAAIASQITSEAPRFYIAIGGALLLAVVSFLTGRLMGSEQISARVRARAAALKREAFKFAARASPLR